MVGTRKARWQHVYSVQPGGKRPLEASRHKWEDNIEIDLEIRCDDVDWS
jgi:hypothetical protein